MQPFDRFTGSTDVNSVTWARGVSHFIELLHKPLLRCTTLPGKFRPTILSRACHIFDLPRSARYLGGGETTANAAGTARNVMDSRSPRYSPSYWQAAGAVIVLTRM